MIDRYTKVVLTLIATALVYLCVVLTPIPAVQAQSSPRPGEPTGPAQVVIVGWRGAPGDTVPVTVTAPVQVTGRVITEKAGERADRVVLVGWEEGGTRDGKPAAQVRSITPGAPGFPVVQK
ncbi:MAG: hypothetical protein WC815_17730 [Vicinamibacterales bacterium]|jgi:hypothetical protein